MRNTATHQVLAPTQPTDTTMQARVTAALARVEAGAAAGTAQTGGEPAKGSRLTVVDLLIPVAAGGIVAFALAFVVQVVAGWFTPVSHTDGICREYGNQVVVCVPAYSPDGADMTRMWEDGSAVYSDGYVFGGYSEA